MWWVIRGLHHMADLTVTVSHKLGEELKRERAAPEDSILVQLALLSVPSLQSCQSCQRSYAALRSILTIVWIVL